MTKPLKLVSVGNSVGVVLPKEILARLRVQRGDQLYLSETTEGAFRLTAFDPEFAGLMAMGEEIMREDRDILRVLSK